MKIQKVPFWVDSSTGVFAILGALYLAVQSHFMGHQFGWDLANSWFFQASLALGGCISIAMALTGVSQRLAMAVSRKMFGFAVRAKRT